MDGLMFDTETMYSRVLGEIAKKKGKEFTLDTKTKCMGKHASEAMSIISEAWGSCITPKELLKEHDRTCLYCKERAICSIKRKACSYKLIAYMYDERKREETKSCYI